MLFSEVQRLHVWIRTALSVAAVIMISFFGYGMVKQLVMGEQWGNKPMSDTMLTVVAPFFISLSLLILWVSLSAKLETRVEGDGIYIRYFPFYMRFKKISPDEITGYEACTYNPVLDYGGWGIRFGLKGKAYNIRGNRGVRLAFAGGSTLLVGSERPEELVSAIDIMKGRG